MDIRFGGRGRSNSRISKNDVLATDSNHNDNTINDQNDAYDAANSTNEAPFPPTITKWDSVHSLSNVKTPARSFYHRAFHGSLGWFRSVFSIDLNSSDSQTCRSGAVFFSWRP
jgi:SulP family sulfate permease